MLFGGGGTAAAKPKKDEKKEKKSDRDEKYEIQENVYLRWGNSLLANEPLRDFRDLWETKYLASVVHIATGTAITLTGTRIEDCQSVVTTANDSKTSPAELSDCQQKAVVSAWWGLVQAFWRKYAPESIRNEKLTEAIKHWCLEATADYDHVNVCDFTSSWRDGHAFNCLLHNFDRKLIPMKKTFEMTAAERLELTFSTAEKQLQVPRLLQVKDLQSEHLDSHSVVCYLMTLYLSLIGKSSLVSDQPPDVPAASRASASPPQPVPAATPGSEPSTSSAISGDGKLSKAHQQQSMDQQSESVEIRSRKSSSSSQKSGKSRRERREAMAREFENYLEQVLTWLLEAEEELTLLQDVEKNDVAIVRAQFKDFEQFMCSLTDSQETVGRVLHRGQLLCAKTENEEEKDAIQHQLQIVNQRWEELRHAALKRQTLLQSQLNLLQNKALAEIKKWLASVEAEIQSTPPVATNDQDILKQIDAHNNLQSRIEDFQPKVLALNAFVAVVDDGESASEAVTSLEEAMREVGDRWQNLCNWAETRSSQLDGLAELVVQHANVYSYLSSWLDEQEQNLQSLKSAHHLGTVDEVAEQVHKLHSLESQLEAKHSKYVQLSQLSMEIVTRLDSGNGAAANEIRRKLDSITQRWENVATRVDEHSKTLLRSGKAAPEQFKADKSRILVADEPERATTSQEPMTTSTAESTEASEGEEARNQLVDRFVRHVERLSSELEDLRMWTESFSVSRRPDQMRRMISMCQEKLVEIKDQEAKVTRLQLELEHLHLSPNITASQLRTANDSFDAFAKGWARIVTKISEAMNALTGNDNDETTIAAGIQKWIDGCEKVISGLEQVSPKEREKRLEKLESQWATQSSNLEFIEKDAVKKAILKKGLDIIKKKLNALTKEAIPPEVDPIVADLESALAGPWATVGNAETLAADLARSEKLVEKARAANVSPELVEKAETRRAEMEERRRATTAAFEKLAIAESTVTRVRARLDGPSQTGAELAAVVNELTAARDELASRESERKEAERTTEKMLQLDDNVPAEVVTTTRARLKKLSGDWRELRDAIDDALSCATKERRRRVQKALEDEQRLIDKLEQTLAASENVADAEECSEQLDNLEQLLERVTSPETQISPSDMEESNSRENYQRLAESKEKVTARAKARLEELNKAVEDCEKFERQLSGFHHWASQMGPLLSSRIAADVSALDVPDEYKMLAAEFDDWNKTLDSLESSSKNNPRAKEQLELAHNNFNSLKRKFAEFKQPKSFQEKLEKTIAQLSEIENALDDLTGIKGNECAHALEDARARQRQLRALEDDVHSLVKANEDLVKGGMLESSVAASVGENIRDAARKTKELASRAETNVDRLEDCVSLYGKLEDQAKGVQEFLTKMEDDLDVYVTQEEGEDADVERLVSEWNRQESNLKELEDLTRVLRERAVKVDDRLCTDLRKRAQQLKHRLDSWTQAMHEMEEDEETQLLLVDEMQQSLLRQLRGARDKPVPEIAETLRFLRGDRDRLSTKVRRLATKNPRLGAALVADVTKEWDDLEQKLTVPEQQAENVEVEELNTELSFPQQVDWLWERCAKAGKLLDFEKSPVNNVQQWRARLQALDDFLQATRPPLEQLMDTGRQIANNGRLELNTHAAIDRLDELCLTFDELGSQLDEHRDQVAPLIARAESLSREVVNAEDLIDKMCARDLNSSDVAKATRRELAEKDNYLASLSQRAAALHAALPGASSHSRDTTLTSLNGKIAQLDSALGAIRDAREESKTSPDRTSASSIGPLAMEVHGTDINTTDDESPERPKIISPEKTSPPREVFMTVDEARPNEELPRSAHHSPAEEAFNALSELEDMPLEEEQFPLEDIDHADERLAKYNKMLDSVEKLVEDNQMTLDMLQTETALERVQHLRKALAERKQRISPLKQEWQQLLTIVTDAESTLKGAANSLSPPPRNDRGRSPPIEELEQRQIDADHVLSRAESQVCDAFRRLGVVLPRLADDGNQATTIRTRVRNVENRLHQLADVATENRMRIEARAVDEAEVRKQLEELEFWCDEAQAETSDKRHSLDVEALEQDLEAVERRINELPEKKACLNRIEAAKERLLQSLAIDEESKHGLRRAVCDIAKRTADLRSDLTDRREQLLQQKSSSSDVWKRLRKLSDRADDLNRRTVAISTATIFSPSGDHIAACRSDAEHLERDMSVLKRELEKNRGQSPSKEIKKKLNAVFEDCERAIRAASALPERSVTASASESLRSSQATVVATEGRTTEDSHASPVASSDTEEEEEIEDAVAAGSLTSSQHMSEKDSMALSPRDESHSLTLTQLRNWLGEAERDASMTVDLADHNAARTTATTVQTVIDQLRQKIFDVVRIHDSSAAAEVKKKAKELADDMERVARQCEGRRAQLMKIAEASKECDSLSSNMQLWLGKVEATISARKAEESTEEEVRKELTEVEEICDELEEKQKMMQLLNSKSNVILDDYDKDEAHNLSQLMSRLNSRWSRCSDNVRIRRAVLEACLRSRNDFQSALDEFEQWLDGICLKIQTLDNQTSNTQMIKDTGRRREAVQQHKVIQAEMDAHQSVLAAVEDTGRKMCSSLDQGKERNDLSKRVEQLAKRWHAAQETQKLLRNRFEAAEQEWEKLTHDLSNHIAWIEAKSKEALAQQPVGGSLSSVMAQGAWVKNAEREAEALSPTIRETIEAAHSFLMQHDLRPKIHRPGVFEDDEMDPADAEQRRCGLQVNADVEQLKEKWAELGQQLSDWHKVIQMAAQKLQTLDTALAECQLHLSGLESEMEQRRAVEDLHLDELKEARVDSENLTAKVDAIRVHVDDANDASGKILAADLPLDVHPRNQLDAVNQRYISLRTAVRVRVAALRNALSDFGPSSEHFLNQSVSTPWQRAISKTNQLPYYIDHTTERTQWEHPVWVEMCRELTQFNRVKFIAYRTAMKLRALQKRLCLDLVDMPMLEAAFARLKDLSNEESPELEGMVCALYPMFESLHAKHPQHVRSVALAVDLCINFLLNLFDPSRDGVLRVLSFKIALVVFSNTPLEDKYRYLFNLVAHEGQADQKHVALLLYDLIQIPRLVGEAAAFGGSNVEPSVRSCFENVRLAQSIGVIPFMDWLKLEPQSVVWLPVMHRLAAAESAKHSAKCNVCKMFPIIGLRYRCLRCFNLDLCQNCFFSQRVAKKHKLKHPMQEYAAPTTSSEDARDFARMIKNKLSRSRRDLGYLPVDPVEEGQPLVQPPAAAKNIETEALHQRTAAMASRLQQLTAQQPAEPRAPAPEVKSPAQLINQVEQMHKDELDQLLQRLQLENAELKRELEKKKTAAASTPHLDRTGHGSPEANRRGSRAGTLPRLSNAGQGRSVPSLKSAQSQGDVMDEARALRLHKQRLEHRSRILEQQNEQLELQLQRLKKVIDQQKEASSRFDSTSAEREWMERSQPPPEASNYQQPQEGRGTRMHSLLATVDDLNRAMESLVVSVVYDSDVEQ